MHPAPVSKARFWPVLLAAALASGAGCGYDWELGPPAPGTGGGGAGSGGAGSASGGGAGSGGAGGAPDCAALGAAIDAAREQAKSCTIGASGQCATSIVDELGCTSFVRDGASADAAAFAGAVEAFNAAGCPPPGGQCMPGTMGTCLYNAGQGPYCLP